MPSEYSSLYLLSEIAKKKKKSKYIELLTKNKTKTNSKWLFSLYQIKKRKSASTVKLFLTSFQ